MGSVLIRLSLLNETTQIIELVILIWSNEHMSKFFYYTQQFFSFSWNRSTRRWEYNSNIISDTISRSMCTCHEMKISFCSLIMVLMYIRNMKIWSLTPESMEYSLILLIRCSIIWPSKKILVYYKEHNIIQLLNRGEWCWIYPIYCILQQLSFTKLPCCHMKTTRFCWIKQNQFEIAALYVLLYES